MPLYELPKLPYAREALSPFLSAETLEYHYAGHHKAYVTKTNELLAKSGQQDQTLEQLIQTQEGAIYDQAGQAWNHTFYWMGLSPQAQSLDAGSALHKAVAAKYQSLDGLKTRFIEAGTQVFGSGWTWFVADAQGQIDVVNTRNGDNPMRSGKTYPIYTCDIWEHAYYIDYRNVRKKYLEAAWEHINWSFVDQNYRLKGIPDMSKLMHG